MCVCVCIHACVCIHDMCVYVCVCVFVDVCTHVHISVCICKSVCVSVCVYVKSLTLCFIQQVISPWRLPEFYKRFPGRNDLFEYARVRPLFGCHYLSVVFILSVYLHQCPAIGSVSQYLVDNIIHDNSAESVSVFFIAYEISEMSVNI